MKFSLGNSSLENLDFSESESKLKILCWLTRKLSLSDLPPTRKIQQRLETDETFSSKFILGKPLFFRVRVKGKNSLSLDKKIIFVRLNLLP
ncbi:MAG: hypothetical protein F6K40_30285 [Okeania sp. SIO3I5]|uniref:hypothetical protein n=1 Tax=Okeania sp. SIO3I5 TaxID=2607805 RepID=UPI0013B963D4|nr:hypothetical protein [Okeania sp. SIO3I5]NEQ40297.1 hypothetical protein [Okeania sp. SIO3I5]